MSETLEQQAKRLWPERAGVPEQVTLHNRAAWLKAVKYLGDRWVGRVKR